MRHRSGDELDAGPPRRYTAGMHKSGQTLFLMLALALPLCAGADFGGKVIGVADGDPVPPWEWRSGKTR